MKGIELGISIKEETHEEIAKRVIEDIQKIIKDRKEELKVAEDKLSEVLEKDIEDIKDKDGKFWEW